jgi:hypothetical protein
MPLSASAPPGIAFSTHQLPDKRRRALNSNQSHQSGPYRLVKSNLGVDPRCPAEVYSQGRDQNGLHQYGGWFHLVGELEAEIDNIESVGEHFVLWLTRHVTLVPAAFENSSVVQLEFVAGVPWVINEPQPE